MRAALVLVLAWLALTGARADEVQGFRFHIVTGDDSGITRHIADDLYKRLSPIAASYRTELAQRRRMVYIAIGPVALREVLARKTDAVVISAFTASQVWRAEVQEATSARAAAMTAVYAEPAPADQLRLIALLYKRPVKIAAIVSRDAGFLKPILRGAGEIEELRPNDSINRALEHISQADVLLAMPDNGVYNTESIRNVLLSTYRHKQGVIGFSADMVKAGALASTYSDIEDINAQITEMVSAFIATGELAAPQFPRYFKTIVNEGVARSLEIAVDGEVRGFARKPPGHAP